MAIHHDYSGRENEDPGRWYAFQKDPDTGKIAEIRFRRMGRKRARDLDAKYRKPVSVEVKGKVVERLEISQEDAVEMMMEAVDWCWLDVREFIVSAHSQDTIAMFIDELGDSSLVIGADIRLDGRLTSRIRRWCLDEIPGLTPFIMELWKAGMHHFEPGEGRPHEERMEAALTRNLSTGSSSRSATVNLPAEAPGVENAVPSAEEKASLASRSVS